MAQECVDIYMGKSKRGMSAHTDIHILLFTRMAGIKLGRFKFYEKVKIKMLFIARQANVCNMCINYQGVKCLALVLCVWQIAGWYYAV